MKSYGYFAGFALLLALFLFGQGPAELKLKISSGVTWLVDSAAVNRDLKNRIFVLEKENEDLKTQVFNADNLPPKTFKVYSSYPVNNTNEIAIAGGKSAGIAENDVVTYGKTLLVGKIKRVYENYSTATTLRNPGWEMAVRIGTKEIDGLLRGGNNLTVELIPEEGDVKEGDIVVSAGTSFPYGLNVGKIRTVSEDPALHFKTATVEPSVQFKALRNVSIYRK